MGILSTVEDKRNFRVTEEKSFTLVNGDKLYTLDELSEAINLIEPEVFHNHVNEHKNDFANWVEGVFEEPELATRLREHPTPLRMMVSIEKFLRMGSMPTTPAAETPQFTVAPTEATPTPAEHRDA
ncbi:hypothetical protein BH11PAT4_BH11PAT4_5070 [soil metagenome]